MPRPQLPETRARPIPPWLWATLAVYAAHGIYLLLAHPANRALATLVNLVMLDLLCWLGVWMFFRASRRVDLPDDMRRGMRWALIPVLLQGIEGIVLVLMALAGTLDIQVRSWENIPLLTVDIIGQASEISLVFCLLRMPDAQKIQRGAVRSVVDALAQDVDGATLGDLALEPGEEPQAPWAVAPEFESL